MVRPDEIVNMPRWKRRSRRTRIGKRRGSYAIEESRSFSREELLDYLKNSNYHTRTALRNGRKRGEPSDYDYTKEFGNFSNAIAEAFGRREVDKKEQDMSMVKAVVYHKLWTKQRWLAERKRLRLDVPCIEQPIPSEYAVRKSWGCFTNLKWVAVCYDKERQLTEYLRISRRLGRKASLTECITRGLDMRELVGHFGSKKKLDDFLEGRWYEKGKGSQAET